MFFSFRDSEGMVPLLNTPGTINECLPGEFYTIEFAEGTESKSANAHALMIIQQKSSKCENHELESMSEPEVTGPPKPRKIVSDIQAYANSVRHGMIREKKNFTKYNSETSIIPVLQKYSVNHHHSIN